LVDVDTGVASGGQVCDVAAAIVAPLEDAAVCEYQLATGTGTIRAANCNTEYLVNKGFST